MRKRIMLESVRLEMVRAGRIDAGTWARPSYAVRFVRGDRNCIAHIRSTGPPESKRPLGSDVIDAMRDYIRRGEITEESLLSMPILD